MCQTSMKILLPLTLMNINKPGIDQYSKLIKVPMMPLVVVSASVTMATEHYDDIM